MKTTLIIPPLVSRKNSVSSGIFFMPFTMAHLAGTLRQRGFEVSVIDMFAEAPHRATLVPPNIYLGISSSEMVSRLPSDTQAVLLFAWGVASFKALESMAAAIRKHSPELPIIVIENAHAVTSMSLTHVAGDVLAMGVDYVILGECEERVVKLLEHLQGEGELPEEGIARIVQNKPEILPSKEFIQDLDALAFPAWDLFPIEAYWKLGYAHGPQEGRYLALLTSRGCPFGCRFCIIPSTNQRRWRARSAHNVFEEMCYWHKTMGVSEFHIEDVNPTTETKRLAELGDLISEAKLPFIWKFASGTKIETISLETLKRMAAGGCRYVSFSPESGSKRVLKLMNKPFNHEHALLLTKQMYTLGISSQAVFILGFPGEEDEDRCESLEYLSQLVKNGLDEVLVLVTTPVPGSDIFGDFNGFSDYSELTFTPTYRKDYRYLLAWQRRMYRRFILLKIIHQPLRCVGHAWNFVRRRFKTKMEMTLWRYLIVKKDLFFATKN